MSENAIMPMEDYKAICDVVRYRGNKVIVNNKKIYPTNSSINEILTPSILLLGEKYSVKYHDGGMMVDIEGVYEVKNINVQGKDRIGFIDASVDPVGSPYTVFIYQDGENVMLNVQGTTNAFNVITITLERIIGEILSGALADKVKETVYESGKLSKWNEFWNLYQNYGNRTNYLRAFYQLGWNDTTYNPKYPITADSNYADEMFAWSDITDTKVSVKITGGFNASNVFTGCQDLITIRSLNISEYSGTFSGWFVYCEKLKNLNIAGTIKNDFDVSYCTNLTNHSLLNILYALNNYAGTGVTKKITVGATNLAKLTDNEKEMATQKGWKLE